MDLLYKIFLNITAISFNMSLIIIAALIFRKISKNKISAAGRYVIWILIAVRLIIPFTADLEISVFRICESDTPELNERVYSVEIMGQPYTVPQTSQIPENNLTHDPVIDTAGGNGNVKTFITAEGLMDAAAVIWIAGVIFKLAYSFIGYKIFTANLKRNIIPVGDKRIMLIFRHMCRKMNIEREPELYLCGNITSPMIYGMTRKRIVIPTDISNSAAITSILRHELIHLKRCDLWIKLIYLAADSLHWFNPLIWKAGKYLELDMELSCDEKVLYGCNKTIRRTYGKIMIDIAQRCVYKPAALTTHFNPKFNDLKTRCINILDTGEKSKGTFIIILFTVLCLISGMFLNCTKITAGGLDYDTEITLHGSNIIISNKANSVIDTSDNFDLENFIKFIGRFSNVIYGEINAPDEIDFNDPQIINYIISETEISFSRTVREIFGVDLNADQKYSFDCEDPPELLMNIVNVNANEYGEVTARIMYYDITAAESGMSSDTYIGDGTYYFYFRDDINGRQIYTFRFCFGERDYDRMTVSENQEPVLVQYQDKSLQIINPDKTMITTPAYFRGEAGAVDIYNRLISVGDTYAIAGRESKSPDEQINIHATNDGGNTWHTTLIDCMPVTNFIFNYTSESDGMLILSTNRSEIYVYTTSNGGVTWMRQSNFTVPGYENESVSLYAGGFITKDTGFFSLVPLADSHENPNVYMTKDGGHSWKKMDIKPPPESAYDEKWSAYALVPEMSGNQIRVPVIVYTRDTLYYVSDDSGSSWYWSH